MTICDLYSWVRWIQIMMGRRRKDDVCSIGVSTESIKDCSHWHRSNIPIYPIYKYMVTVYVMHTRIHCKTRIFTSSFIKPGWSKLHFVTLVLCWSTGGFAPRGRTTPAGQTSCRGSGLRVPGEIPRSPVIEHTFLCWGRPETFLSACYASTIAWYAAALGFDGTF